MKVSVVNSAGSSFCWNYVTDTLCGNYAGDNICCIYAGFEVVLSVTGMLVDLSVKIMQVTVSVAIMQLEVSAAHMQVTVSAANMWVTIFIVIMQMGVSVAVMQVVFSAVHYAHECFYCNYVAHSLFYSSTGEFQVTISYSFLLQTYSFHKIDQKTFKGIMSGLYFTTFVNILPELINFEGRNYMQIGYKSYSILLFS